MLLPKITSDNVEDIRKWKPDVLTSITKYKVVGTSLKLLAVQEFEKKEVVNQWNNPKRLTIKNKSYLLINL